MEEGSVKVREAIESVLTEIDPVRLHYLEGCVSCGLCGPHCPFYYADVKYEPVNKAEEMRFIYRKEMTLAGKLLGTLVGAKLPKTEEDLKRIREMAYRCTNCRYCYQTCPMGIYSGELIMMLRQILDKTGMTPACLTVLKDIEVSGDMSKTGLINAWNEVLDRAKESIGKELPLDKQAELVYLPWLIEAILTPEVIVDTIVLLDKLGLDWSMPSKPLAIEPALGTIMGDTEARKIVFRRIVDYVKSVGGKKALLSHGGTPYMDLRFELPFVLGERAPFKVIHVVELLHDMYSGGKIQLKQDGVKVTWHDPCKMARGGGLIEEPRALVRATSKHYRDLPKGIGMYSYCCGGGTGLSLMAEEGREILRSLLGGSVPDTEFCEELEKDHLVAVKNKIEEIEESGAELVVTGCSTCIHTINKGAEKFGKEFRAVHIVTYLKDYLT